LNSVSKCPLAIPDLTGQGGYCR